MNQTMYVRYLSWEELKSKRPQMTQWFKLTRDIAVDIYNSPFWQTVDFRAPDYPDGYILRCTRSSKNGQKKWFATVPTELQADFLHEIYPFDPEKGRPNFYKIKEFYNNANSGQVSCG